MFNKAQFVQVFQMQNDLNIKAAGADWKSKNLPWDLAVIREVGEALDHLNWEWWKKTQPNYEQAKLEIIDIIHFAVSGASILSDDIEKMYEEAVTELDTASAEVMNQVATWDVFEFLREITVTAVMRNYGFTMYLAIRAANSLGMSTDEVFNAYVAKNVLNAFRKANGYKEGTYIKQWYGREDNEFLTEFLAEDTLNSVVSSPEMLFERLNNVYKDVVKPVVQ